MQVCAAKMAARSAGELRQPSVHRGM